MRRVVFSLDPKEKDDIKFYVLVVADVKNGFEIREIFYYKDLKKVSYGLMSIGEYQHRIIQSSSLSPGAMGDRTGKHVQYKDITLDEFISAQIEYRINLKFQKPEVEQNADIDKEIGKIISETLRIYYQEQRPLYVEMDNIITDKKISLDQDQIWTDMQAK